MRSSSRAQDTRFDETPQQEAVEGEVLVRKTHLAAELVRSKNMATGQLVLDIATDEQERTPREAFREGTFHGLREVCP